VRCDSGWIPASVRNISSRGMMLRIKTPLPKGTYVDIELAGRLVTGRVAWSNDNSCGFQLQDRIEVASFRGVRAKAAAAAQSSSEARPVARLSAEQISERSRRASSLFQYLIFAAVGLSAASLLAVEAYKVLSAPLEVVKSKLD
jgi:hypothetical protein